MEAIHTYYRTEGGPLPVYRDKTHYLYLKTGRWVVDESPDWLGGNATLVEITEAEARRIVEDHGGVFPKSG